MSFYVWQSKNSVDTVMNTIVYRGHFSKDHGTNEFFGTLRTLASSVMNPLQKKYLCRGMLGTGTRYKCLNLAIYKGEDIHKYTGIGRRPLSKNPDVVLHNLVDECNKFQSLIAKSNTVKSNETRAYIIKKSEIGRPTENNPADCLFLKHHYQDGNSYGHKEGFCQSSQRRPYPGYRKDPYHTQPRQTHDILTTIQININTGSDIIFSNKAGKTIGSPELGTILLKVSSALCDAVHPSRAKECEAAFKGKLPPNELDRHVRRHRGENPKRNPPTSANK
ncbi:hypothetical protein ACTXT7_011428 [Hymenolepis weldensis]